MENILQESKEGWKQRQATTEAQARISGPERQRQRQETVAERQRQEEELDCLQPGQLAKLVSMVDINNTDDIDVSNFEHTVKNFQAGAISRQYENWSKLTSDKWILNLVQGYEVDFKNEPWQPFRPNQLKLDKQSTIDLDKALNEFLELGIIEPCDYDEDGFYSTLFTTPKRDGTARVIFNLSDLNEFIKTDHFKMETVKQAIDLMIQDCYFASIDLKHAYYSVLIDEEYRKYFRFLWNGQAYQFIVMAQGLSTAPRDYTKLLKPPFSALRIAGFTVLGYIDDSIFIEEQAEDIKKALNAATQLFDKLGMTISVKKSVFEPTQEIEYLGFLLNSKNMTVTLTQRKKDKIEALARRLYRKTKFPVRKLCKFIGNAVAAEQGVWSAPLHYKPLELARNEVLKEHRGNFDAEMYMTPEIKKELLWWITNIQGSMRFIDFAEPALTLYSDASKKGWGGHIKDTSNSTGGAWSEAEAEEHINVLELIAAFLILKTYCAHMHDCHIRLMLDNTTAIACINKFGSIKPKLLKVTQELYEWAEKRRLFLSAAHVPGVDNVLADKESRTHKTETEWKLKENWFNWICEQLGKPEIDLFASRINKQLPKYVAWRPDPEALWIDAFIKPWNDLNAYIFPPFSLMTRVLRKLEVEGATATVIFPDWPTSPWYARLLQRRTSQVLRLSQDCLYLPQDKSLRHPLRKRLRLCACKVSGKSTKSKA